MRKTSSMPFFIRAIAFAALRTLKFIRHSILRIRSGSRTLRYRIRETAWGKTVWKAVAVVRAPRETRRRRQVAAQNTTLTSAAMDRHTGYCLLPESSELKEVLTTCRQIFERKVPEYERASVRSSGAAAVSQGEKLKDKRMFLRNLLDNDDLRAHPQLVDFALSDWALGIATKYLGMVPHLNRVDLLYSVARPTEDRIASQLFHVDPEGVTQVKFFINVFDTNDDQGPFTFIPADETDRILRGIRLLRRKQGKSQIGRYTDEEIAAVGGSAVIISVKGPHGSGVAVDTSRCLHLGSRVRPGSFRLCMYLQYCASIEHGNVFDVERYRHDPLRLMAVRESLKSAGSEVTAPHQMS